ncbi:sentrin-specific protease 1-like isoform X2 [Mercenaria mercenaria]|uniref:sentrin-specific protease 1-like isoform X2 n=1 Tax=Mercenaria mercenaria TaxID=6596 RepID=UPI00234E3ACF|nr:sentrin-specific protease 1-like isoform X2 [Mercenaria mercenaria]
MINSFTNSLKTFIFSSKSSENAVKTDRKRKRPYEESDGDDDIQVLSVKKSRREYTGLTGLFTSATVQSMSDWVQKKTPNLFNWTSSKKKSASLQGNGQNGRSKEKQGFNETSSHHGFSRIDVPMAYRQGTWPMDGGGSGSLVRPSIHSQFYKSQTVQTDAQRGPVGEQGSQARLDKMFRTRNKHRFTAKDSVRLEDKVRYQQLIQKFTTVPLEEEENKSKVNESIKDPIRVPQLPSSNNSILGSTIHQQPDKVDVPVRHKIKVQPSQSTPRQLLTNGNAAQDETLIPLTDISVIPSVRTDIQQTDTIDLTDEKEPDKPEKDCVRERKFKSHTPDYRDCKFLSENWIKEITSTYSAKARERERQLAEAEVRTKIFDERRKQDEADLERRIRRQMHIHKKAPAVVEDLPLSDLSSSEDEVEIVEEEEEGLPELTSEMENVINNALSRGNPGQVLVDKFRLQITKGDIATLSGLNWLNDEVINFYMNLLMERGEKEGCSKVYAFNTFFYPKVMSGGQAAVKRWTRRVDVLAVDYILIPVHLGMHWCLAVINFKKKDIQYYDSMGGNNQKCLNALRQYLCDESLDKKKTEFNLNGWNSTIVKDIPQQMNGSDCGMFACKYAEYITREASITFTQEDMPYFRRRMVYEIVSAKLLQ